jgi:putative transposase
MERFGASLRQACAVIKLSRVVYLYKSNARDNSALVMRMKEITQTRVHHGYRRVHVMLRREGFKSFLRGRPAAWLYPNSSQRLFA